MEVEGKAFVVRSATAAISRPTDRSRSCLRASPQPLRRAQAHGHRAAGEGNIWKVIASEGRTVAEGDVLLILEAMKMETEIPRRTGRDGTRYRGEVGDAVSVGDTLMTLAATEN
ncbi:acetyl-CoA carboxylase biotin carboxyl carrier protein subunit [Salmonella enterica subsp. enterica]|nr:acetyl-CoA carboxylase biotin carboxyl carrier protein subunit [Salmonella enterica subsp. enterica]